MTERTAAKATTSSPVPAPLCPTCEAPSRFVTSMLDLRQDRPILLYRCDACREEVWVDQVAPMATLPDDTSTKDSGIKS